MFGPDDNIRRGGVFCLRLLSGSSRSGPEKELIFLCNAFVPGVELILHSDHDI